MTRSTLAAAALAALAACTPPPATAPRAGDASSPMPVVRAWPALGTLLYVAVWDPDTTRGLAAIDSARAAVLRVDETMPVGVLALPLWAADLLDSLGLDRRAAGRGSAVDRGMGALRAAGVRRAVIDLGGTFAVLGSAPVGPRWSIGLPNPFQPGEVYAALQVDRGAVATFAASSDSARVTASVSVLAPTAALAAALSRAFQAMGPEAGCRLAARHRVQAVWVRTPDHKEDGEDRDADDGVDPDLVVVTAALAGRLELLSEEPATERPARCSEVK